MAESLGETEQVTLLTQTLDEEKETDEKLTELAKEINSAATVQTSEREAGDETKSKARQGDTTSAWLNKPLSLRHH